MTSCTDRKVRQRYLNRAEVGEACWEPGLPPLLCLRNCDLADILWCDVMLLTVWRFWVSQAMVDVLKLRCRESMPAKVVSPLPFPILPVSCGLGGKLRSFVTSS